MKTPPAPSLPPAAVVPSRASAADPDRIRNLFRHALRSGQVNPLIHVLLAYRAAAAS